MGLEDFIPKQQGGQGGDPEPHGDLGAYVKDVGKFDQGHQLASATNFPIDQYSPWVTEGVNSRFNMDLKRAQNQGLLESAAIRMGNLIPNIAGGLVENIGYLGSLVSEWGDDKDYNNALTKFGNSMKNPFGTVYREHPDKVWDLSDPAWWGDSFQSLTESAASFALEGAGLAKIFMGLTNLAKATKFAGLVRGAAELGTSAIMAYTEGAQIGAQVFDQTYNAQLQKAIDQGIGYEDAKHQARQIASNAAATTVQLNTLINTGLNLPQLAPLFMGEEDVMHWWKTAGMKQEGEGFKDWANRIKNSGTKTEGLRQLIDPRHVGLTHIAVGAASEGIEEVVNDFAQARGEAAGKEGLNKHNLNTLLSNMGDIFNDTMNEQGALDFVLGAVGGLAQDVAIDRIPIHKVTLDEKGQVSTHTFDGTQDENGKYKKKLVSSHYLTSTGNRQYFENVKEKVVSDINRIDEMKEKLAKAVAENKPLEAEKIKQDFFAVGALYSVQLGMGDSFKAQFKNIAQLDNDKSLHEQYIPQIQQLTDAISQETDQVRKQELTKQRDQVTEQMNKMVNVTEAMQKGFAKNKNDNSYKDRAQEAQTDIDHYTKMWDEIHKQYRFGDEWDSRYADYLFGREIDHHIRGKIIKDTELKVKEMEAKRNEAMHPDEDPVSTQSLSDYNTHMGAREQLKVEEASIRRALSQVSSKDAAEQLKGRETLKTMAEKYGVVSGDEDLVKGAHAVLKHIKERTEDHVVKAYDKVSTIGVSEQAQAWMAKHPGKNITDYIQALQRKTREDEDIQVKKTQLALFRDETMHARKELDNLRRGIGRKAYIAQAKSTQNKLVKMMKEKIDKNNAAQLEKFYNKKNLDELNKTQKEQYISILTEKINKKKAAIDKAKQERSEAAKKLGQLNAANLIERLKKRLDVYKLSRQIDQLSATIKGLENDVELLQKQLDNVQIANAGDNSVLPEQKTDNEAALNSSKAADVENWFGNIKAYEQMLDEIWALKPGPRDQVLTRAEDIMMRKLDALDHAIFYIEDKAVKDTAIAHLRTFLEAQLKEAGKIETTPGPNETTESKFLNIIESFGLPEDQAAELITALDELEEHLSDPKKLLVVMKELKKQYKLSKDQISQLATVLNETIANRASTQNKVDEAQNDPGQQLGLFSKKRITTENGEEITPDGSSIMFAQRGKTQIMYDTEKGRFYYQDAEGNERTPKQSMRIANRITKSYFKNWYREMASPEQKALIAELEKESMDVLRDARYQDHVDTLRYFLMRQINGMRFTPNILKDLTDVSAKKWSAESREGGYPLDTFVSDILGTNSEDGDSELARAGFDGHDEQEIMNMIKELIQEFPRGITKKALAEEERANSTVAKLENLEYQFLHETGLSLTEALNLYDDVKAEETAAEEDQHGEDNGESEVEETGGEGPVETTLDELPEGPGPITNKGQSTQLSIFTAGQMDGMTHGGMKTESALKVNVLTHEYMDTVLDDMQYDKEDTHSLNPSLNPLWVKPGYFKAGDQLMLVVDRNYKGTTNDDKNFVPGGPNQVPDEFGFYADSDGKVNLTDDEKVGNVPIKVVDPRSGTTVGYLPRTNWVTAQYPNLRDEETDFRNVVDTKHDAEGNLVYKDNVAKQKAALLELRRKLVDAHNKGYADGLPTVISSRSRGIALRVEPDRASTLLPDTSLRLAMMHGTAIKTGKDVAENAEIPSYLSTSDKYNNVPGILIPDAAGRLNFEPLWCDRIEQGEIDTILKVVELYLGAGTEFEDAATIADIEQATGFNVSTAEGMEAWLNQYYYYTQAFADSDIMANQAVLKGAKRVPDFKIAIAKNPEFGAVKGVVKAGMTYLGRLAYASLDANGQLNQDFVELMTQGLSTRFKNVVFSRPEIGVRGINSTGKLTEVVYHPQTNTFSTKEHASYNDRVKAMSNTRLEGRLQASDGTYVYYAHPNTQLDAATTLSQEVFERRRRPRKEDVEVPKATEVEPEVTEEEAEEAFGLDTELWAKPRVTRTYETRSTVGTLEGQTATLENLESLRNFTPLENRNNLTPAEALARMKSLGLATIAPGYNPFYEC